MSKNKPEIKAHQDVASATSDSEDSEEREYALYSDQMTGSGDESEDMQIAEDKFKPSRSTPIRLSKDISSDQKSLKFALVDAVFHAKAHLKSSVIKACGEIVSSWGIDVPAIFVPYNMNGNKFYNSYKIVMNQVAASIAANSGNSYDFGKTASGQSKKPAYYSVAEDILKEIKMAARKKEQAKRKKEAKNKGLDLAAGKCIDASLVGSPLLPKDKRKNTNPDGTVPKQQKVVDPFDRLLNVVAMKMELDVKQKGDFLDLTGDSQEIAQNPSYMDLCGGGANPQQSSISAADVTGKKRRMGPATQDDIDQLRQHVDQQFEDLEKLIMRTIPPQMPSVRGTFASTSTPA